MKPFNLEEAKAGAPLVTRDGQKARLICSNFKNSSGRPILVIFESEFTETVHEFYENGRFFCNGEDYYLDLFMAPTKRECWINLFKTHSTGLRANAWETEEQAKDRKCLWGGFIKTIHVEWEE